MATAIVLNGTSSAGKTSLARAVQKLASIPILHIQMDAFLDMQPPRLDNHPDGFVFRSVEHADPPEVSIETGPYGARLLDGMRRSVAALADAGLDVIVDDVWLGGGEREAYDALMPAHKVWFVGVYTSLEACEGREKSRGDRDIGLARWQFGRVHHNTRYDLEVDATHSAPVDIAQIVVDRFGL